MSVQGQQAAAAPVSKGLTAKCTENASALMLMNVGGVTFTRRFIDQAPAWLGKECKALMHLDCPQYLQSTVHLGSCCPDEAAGPVEDYCAADPLAASVAASGPWTMLWHQVSQKQVWEDAQGT